MMDVEAATDLRALELRLERRLTEVLPGTEAHRRLAPRPRRGWDPDRTPGESRDAAALVLLYEREGSPHLVLTVRSGELTAHSGQVSFPGGAVEEGEGIVEAALREAREEVGIDPEIPRVLGLLTPLHIPASGFVLHPVAAISDRVPRLRPSDEEVDRILEVPVAEMLREDRRRHETWTLEGREVEVPYIEVDGEPLWGATAMVVAELLWLLSGEATTG